MDIVVTIPKTEKCHTTGRIWSGVQIFMDDLKHENLDVEVKGFRGFRYRWGN